MGKIMANKTSLLTADYFAKLVGGEVGKFILQQQLAILELEKKALALDEWFEKTDWLEATTKEPGMHRADILRQRIEELEKEVKRLKS